MLGDQFGQTIDGHDVERALLAHLEKWMRSYLGDAVREKDPDQELWPGGVGDPSKLGKPAVLPVREFTTRHAAAERWPAEQLPMLLAHSPGFAKPPTEEGDGTLTGFFLINLSAIASGGGIEDTKTLARVYGSAAAKAIMQKRGLGGFAAGVEWADMKQMRPPEAPMERSIMSVVNVFVVEVHDIMNTEDGPAEPLPDPDTSPGPWPTVKEGGGSAEIRSGEDAVEELRKGGFFEPEDP